MFLRTFLKVHYYIYIVRVFFCIFHRSITHLRVFCHVKKKKKKDRIFAKSHKADISCIPTFADRDLLKAQTLDNPTFFKDACWSANEIRRKTLFLKYSQYKTLLNNSAVNFFCMLNSFYFNNQLFTSLCFNYFHQEIAKMTSFNNLFHSEENVLTILHINMSVS